MKLLKNSTYDDIISESRKLKATINAFSIVNTNNKISFDHIDKVLFDISIQRAIVGKRGSGKTHFIKNSILPFVSNPVVLDQTGEYKNLEGVRAIDLQDSRSTSELDAENLDNISQLLIVESTEAIGRYLNSVLARRQFKNFIIVSNSYRELFKINHAIDLIYDFGTFPDQKSLKYTSDNHHKIKRMNDYPESRFLDCRVPTESK